MQFDFNSGHRHLLTQVMSLNRICLTQNNECEYLVSLSSTVYICLSRENGANYSISCTLYHANIDTNASEKITIIIIIIIVK